MIVNTEYYLIHEELLKKVISELEFHGKKATKDTVKKLKKLKREQIEEWGSIVDPDSV